MNINAEEIVRIIKIYFDRIVLGLLGIFFLLVLLFFMMEKTVQPDLDININKQAVIENQANEGEVERTKLFAKKDSGPENNPEFQMLIKHNPFEYKAQRTREAIIKESTDLYKRSFTLYEEENFQEALLTVNKALLIYSSHADAQKLKNILLEKLGGKEEKKE